MKTEIILIFDTEDYTTERNADAALVWANLLTEEGVTGHFSMVGQVAEHFVKWGRSDVLKALEPHVIGFHTYRHSVHPLMAELCDVEDDTAAKAELEARESKGLEQLHRVFGDKPIMFAVPPGMDITHRSIYFYGSKGIPFYLGGLINDDENSLIDYCGATQIPYTIDLEECFFHTEHDIDKLMAEWNKCHRVILNHHPNMLYKTVFWDRLNYDKENRCEFGKWIQAPERPPEDAEAFVKWYRMLVRRLKQDSRFEFTDLHHIQKERSEHLAGPISPDQLPGLIEELKENWGPLKSAAYSVSDIFYAAASFLQGKKSYTPGMVKGFLQTPHGVESEVIIPADAVKQEAQKIVIGDFIPAAFTVAGQKIGAADMLFAMAGALAGEKQIRLKPRCQTIDIRELKKLSTLCLRDMWLFSPEFKDRYVTDRLRLQAWTWRKYGI